MPSFDSTTLTQAEQRVRAATAAGDWADFTAADADRTIRAGFLRHLLLALPGEDDKPWPIRLPGLRIRGALIAGPIDLADCTGPEGEALPTIALEDCDIADPIDLSNTRIARLSIAGSRFSQLNASHARIDGPFRFANTKPFRDTAWISAAGLAVDGDVDGDNAELRRAPANPDQPDAPRGDALSLQSATVSGNVLLRNLRAQGGVWLLGARITGTLECIGAKLRNPGGIALVTQNAAIGGAVLLGDGFEADGSVSLLGARITGNLACDGAKLRNPGGNALLAENAEIGGAALLCNGFEADGSVSLLGARITGDLECGGAKLRNPGGDALVAASAAIGGAALLRDGFEANGSISLLGARITGNLECGGAKLRNPGGDALLAEDAEIGGAVLLRNGFAADGRVSLLGARIAGNLACIGAKLRNPGGIALNAYNTSIGGSFRMVSVTSVTGAMILHGTRIAGDCEITGATFANPTATAIHAPHLQVGASLTLRDVTIMGSLHLSHTRIGASLIAHDLRFPKSITLDGTAITYETDNPDILIDLSHASIAAALQPRGLTAGIPGHIDLQGLRAGSLDDDYENFSGWGDPKTWTLKLDGMVYDRLNLNNVTTGRPIAATRLTWLQRESNFRPQPYRHLAKVLRLQGLPEDARAIAIAEGDATPIRSNFAFRLLGKFWGTGFGYGLDPMAASPFYSRHSRDSLAGVA